jgi:hypothetical protein
MFKHQVIKRSLAAAAVIATAGFPSAAQAMLIGGGGESGIPVTPVESGPSAPQRLDQLQHNAQGRFAIHGRFPSPTASPAPAATAPGGFQWGDAGIGAAGAAVLLTSGAVGVGLARRRRVQHTLAA